MNNCKHEGETGKVCSKCGEKLIDKRLMPLVFIGGVLFISIIAAIFWGKGSGCSEPDVVRLARQAEEVRLRNVKYAVEGSGSSVSLTMTNATGGTEQAEIAKLPWSRILKCAKGTILILSAQNGRSSGIITAEIYVDDKLLKTATSSGAYTIASVSAIVE